MLCAVIGDTSGNFLALNTVLGAIEDTGILTIFCTGNIAAGSEEPDKCIARVREAGVYCVQGSLDRHISRFIRKRTQLEKRLSGEDFQRVALASGSIGSSALEWLGTLPKIQRTEIDGVSMLLSFSSPDGSAKLLTADSPFPVFERHREDANVALVITGGDTEAFSQRVADCLFVHPAPLCQEPGMATYTLIDTEATPWRVEACGVALP